MLLRVAPSDAAWLKQEHQGPDGDGPGRPLLLRRLPVRSTIPAASLTCLTRQIVLATRKLSRLCLLITAHSSLATQLLLILELGGQRGILGSPSQRASCSSSSTQAQAELAVITGLACRDFLEEVSRPDRDNLGHVPVTPCLRSLRPVLVTLRRLMTEVRLTTNVVPPTPCMMNTIPAALSMLQWCSTAATASHNYQCAKETSQRLLGRTVRTPCTSLSALCPVRSKRFTRVPEGTVCAKSSRHCGVHVSCACRQQQSRLGLTTALWTSVLGGSFQTAWAHLPFGMLLWRPSLR